MHRENKLKDHRKRGQNRYGARSNFKPYQLVRNAKRRSARRYLQRMLRRMISELL